MWGYSDEPTLEDGVKHWMTCDELWGKNLRARDRLEQPPSCCPTGFGLIRISCSLVLWVCVWERECDCLLALAGRPSVQEQMLHPHTQTPPVERMYLCFVSGSEYSRTRQCTTSTFTTRSPIFFFALPAVLTSYCTSCPNSVWANKPSLTILPVWRFTSPQCLQPLLRSHLPKYIFLLCNQKVCHCMPRSSHL